MKPTAVVDGEAPTVPHPTQKLQGPALERARSWKITKTLFY